MVLNKVVRKPTKTISGITPVAVMLPPLPCKHGGCVFCPNMNVPQSYTPKSPVVLRASALNYDSYKQVKFRLKAFKSMNHPVEKIEIIIMGGTFFQYPKKFRKRFIKGIFDGLNSKKSKTLLQAKKLNENSKNRCVALCLETRPDWCIKFINEMREYGCTRVELGVQAIDDKIYSLVNRGHKVKDVCDATSALKNAGFKVGYHLMPGLPGSNFKKDLKMFKKIFSDSRFKPDQIKIYPCQVMPGSLLEKWYWEKRYEPYSKEQIESLLIKMMGLIPRYCRVMRIMREIPVEYIVAGTIRIDLRKEVEEFLRKKKSKIKEIRFREIGFFMNENLNRDLKLKITKYNSSKGKEFFLEIVNKQDVLFGLLRLRIFKQGKIKNAIIREIHVYGKSLILGKKGNLNFASQHLGFGKSLLKKAEEICKKNKVDELRVISGVGVREYYRKQGYFLEKEKGEYMIKKLNSKVF